MKRLIFILIMICSLTSKAQIPSIGGYYKAPQQLSEAGCNYSLNNLPSSFLAAWELDETSGTISYDSYGGFNGEITDITLGQAGLINNAYYFPGTNTTQLVKYPSMGELGIQTSDLSISFWINAPYNNVSTRYIITNRWGDYTIGSWVIILRLSLSNTVQAILTQIGIVNPIILTSTAVANSWNHVVVTLSRLSRTMSMYVNNAKYSDTYSSSYDNFTFVDYPLVLGIGWDGFTYPVSGIFLGTVDMVHLWDRALTDCEVEELYNNGNGLNNFY